MRLTKGPATVGLSKTPYRRYLGWIIGSLLLLSIFLASCQRPPPATRTPQDTSAASTPDTKAPPPPPSNSYLAQLPPDATSQLVNLGIKIVIPTYLTPNMTLANYGVGEATTGSGRGPYYWLVYRDDQNRCFAIEYAAGDIGDISLENQESLDSKLFGKGYSLYHGKFSNGTGGALPESDLFTDWLMGEDGFYRLIGAGLVNTQDYGQDDCSNITVEEAITIAESFSYLPTDMRTLDFIPPKPDLSEERSAP